MENLDKFLGIEKVGEENPCGNCCNYECQEPCKKWNFWFDQWWDQVVRGWKE